MKNDKKTQKVRIKNVLLRFLDNFLLDGAETVGDIVKGVDDGYDFAGNRVLSDRDMLEICFLVNISTAARGHGLKILKQKPCPNSKGSTLDT